MSWPFFLPFLSNASVPLLPHISMGDGEGMRKEESIYKLSGKEGKKGEEEGNQFIGTQKAQEL